MVWSVEKLLPPGCRTVQHLSGFELTDIVQGLLEHPQAIEIITREIERLPDVLRVVIEVDQ
ncbi:MAG: hypothetical protein AAGF24_01960 [Cyanobacteria bacterium P01_H01_bin.121]